MPAKINHPYFSVITCTRNRGLFLKENIQSVANQKFTDYEQIFIDGNSKDGTAEILSAYKLINSYRVRIFSQKPAGISAAMNLGIKKSSGKYLIHLHSDDFFDNSDVLAKVRENINRQDNPDMVYGMVRSIDGKGNNLGLAPKFFLFQKSSGFLLKLINYIPHQAVFVRKEIFSRFGYFDEKLSICMDYDFWLRITPGIDWKFIPVVVSAYRIHPDSVSGNPQSMVKVNSEMNLIRNRHLNRLENTVNKIIFQRSA
jgi:glycosyltransferase involved in cell wall biosynthesis